MIDDDEPDELATLRVLAAIHGTDLRDLLERSDRSTAEAQPGIELASGHREAWRPTAEV